jgi:hypothetical protein
VNTSVENSLVQIGVLFIMAFHERSVGGSALTDPVSTGFFSRVTVVSGSDIPILLLITACYAIYRAAMCKKVLNTLGESLGVKNILKFTHRCFDLIHYLAMCVIGVMGMASRPYGICVFWAKPYGNFLDQNPNGFECSMLEKIYFLMFTAYYLVDLSYVWTVTQPRMIIVHHIVTLAMIVSCVILKSPVVGLSIMLLHDLVDVPLYMAKILFYIGFTQAKDAFFVFFVLFCAWLRIVNYPIIVYHCVKIGMKDPEFPILYRLTCVLLCALYVLHLIWQWEILTIIWAVIKGESPRDNRSDGGD